MLDKEAICSISEARLDHAKECLISAEHLLAAEDYKGAANRAYYAVFHAMRAVLAWDGIDRKHHSGIITEFRRLYIKTGKFSVDQSETIQMLSEFRTSSDYDDFG